ncbi:phosphonate ABC transporter ATP-binding protein [Rhodopila sp.]|uniref:phosphonate ABC transporter ATP-binding protein n=1 Tax=Rhodopila sp. TaxID=2480087 RepID=UPI003D0FBD2A
MDHPSDVRLSVRGLTLCYPNGTQALRGIDLEVRAGELLVVLGGNGCGKTTLLRCITRALRPGSGEVWLGGRNLADLNGLQLRQARQVLALIGQHAALVRRRSVTANVVCGALARHKTAWTALGGLPASELPGALACLRQVGLAHLADRRAGTLSGGQAQRVAIARALLQHPLVVLADEPVASLDPEAANDIMRLLRRLAHDEGLAVLCVLHQVDLAFAYADRVVGMRDGSIAFDRQRARLAVDEVNGLYTARAA